MANTVIALKKSATPSAAPADLANGELAINYADGKLFYKHANGTISAITSSGGNSFGTVNANNTLVVADTSGDVLTLEPGTNISIVGDAVNDKITISLKDDVVIPSTGTFKVDAVGGDEGGEIKLANAITNSVLTGDIIIDIYQNKLRFFESTGTNRGAFIDLSIAGAGVSSNLLAGGTGGTTDTVARDTANAAFDKANSANVLAFNTGIGANAWANTISSTRANASNAYAEAIGAAGNSYAQAVGTAGNNYTNTVGTAGNNYTVTVGAAANDWANTISSTRANASNSYAQAIGTAGNNYTNTVGTAGNNYTNTVGAAANGWANTVGVDSRNYANSTFVKLTESSQTITGNLSVVGSFTVSGNTTIVNAENLRVSDPLIYLAGNNYVSDIVDIGFIGNYVNATGQNVHTGLYREHVDKMYYLFQGYDAEPINNHIGALSNNMTLAVLNADLRTSNLVLGGANAILTIGAAFDKANAANVLAFNTGIGANAYTNTVGIAGNNYTITVGAAANGWANTTSATRLANTSGISFNGNLNFPTGNVAIGRADAAYRLDVNGTINAASLLVNGSPIESGISTGKAIAMAIVFG